MSPINRISAIVRFIKQEGATAALLRAMAGLSGMVYRRETAYILARPVDQATGPATRPNGITVGLLREDQIDQLAEVAYCERGEIVRRLDAAQKCIIAKHDGAIVHYSWLTSKSEYAGEIEMLVPVEAGETYLYNCRTLAPARGKGVFPMVIARALDEAGKSGASEMIALVSRANKSSLRAFEKMLFNIREETTLMRFLGFRTYRTRKHERA